MADPDLLSQIPALIEKGGLPAVVGGALLALLYKFGKKESPDAQLADALKELTGEVMKMRLEMTERFTRIESDVRHLEREK